MGSLPYEVVDAFTSTPFQGNQAAVVILDEASVLKYGDDTLFHLHVAQEFNFSETAFLNFVGKEQDSSPIYKLRWFTPTAEFPLCGHATLASAFVLFNHTDYPTKQIHFETLSGRLTAKKLDSGFIELDFPADSTVLEYQNTPKDVKAKHRSDILTAISKVFNLNLDPEEECHVAQGRLGWIIELPRSIPVENLKTADVTDLRVLSGMKIITQAAPTESGHDIYSRVFDPVELVPEDPVTGSAHCILAPYWLGSPAIERLSRSSELKKSQTLKAKQVSSRGGQLEVKWRGDRCYLRGQAITTMKGTLII